MSVDLLFEIEVLCSMYGKPPATVVKLCKRFVKNL